MISYWVWGGGDGGETHQYLNLFCVFKHQGLNRVVVYVNEIPGCHYVKQSWLVAGNSWERMLHPQIPPCPTYMGETELLTWPIIFFSPFFPFQQSTNG